MEQHTDVGHDLLGGSGSELLELAATDRLDAPRALGRRAAIRAGSPAPTSRSKGASSPSPTSSTRCRAIGRTAPRSRAEAGARVLAPAAAHAFDPEVVEAFVLSLEVLV